MFEGFRSARLEGVGGCGIHLVHGGAGPPLLLLHGYPQTHAEWHKVAPSLAERFTVVCPDLRGYGDSDKPAADPQDFDTYCKRTTANDQVAVMRALGFDAWHVVGHDRGVRVGLRMALDHSDRVRSLASLDVVPSLEAFENMDADMAYSWFHWLLMRQPAPLPETLIENSAEAYLDFLLETWTGVSGSITQEAHAEYLRCFRDPDTIRATCHEYRGVTLDLEHDRADRGKKLACPVLVLWAANMPRRPGWQTGRGLDMLQVWRARADDVRDQAMDCGHFIPEERPEALVEVLLGFLEGV